MYSRSWHLRVLPQLRYFTTRSDVQVARDWLTGLNRQTIPRHICEVSFSRSSGPGGQNVNKVNSKATLKVPFDSLLPLVPPLIYQSLRTSRYAAERAQCLVIQSDEERKQANNVEACFDKLYQLLKNTAKEVVPGETTQAQREHVQKLQRAQNEGRIKSKKLHSNKKSSRRGSKYDD
ncbi:hypothetical protein N7522_001239 [Penicillium canescens]|uniref:Prokaryotic-type class I peptide chain release factors domain-containing protein n=1 Tax=Penicillium canescens TaxID=5083 RepID=A0AAD6IN39_PENCN|nr:uncharacterized protein N7446_008308 [Penicillium canescens]KAJ6019172.1 hypothetical protein N7522_001239 [Penicillium canescens]KAJ6033399.1 hypothetical protein N7444_011170 [Penicillium canescens]KAJ6057410.1 hypothetical protein N7460_000684 [Penicillium canescens]KAJ6058725.1 hypothetical protein N7446_008308 [Penicillium canescens]